MLTCIRSMIESRFEGNVTAKFLTYFKIFDKAKIATDLNNRFFLDFVTRLLECDISNILSDLFLKKIPNYFKYSITLPIIISFHKRRKNTYTLETANRMSRAEETRWSRLVWRGLYPPFPATFHVTYKNVQRYPLRCSSRQILLNPPTTVHGDDGNGARR